MKIGKRLGLVTAALVLAGSLAHAAVTTDQIIADYRADGYTWIEIKTGPTQIKVEAVKGDVKVEQIIDIATGTVLKTETEAADADERGREGVQTRTVNRDFVRVVRRDGDDDDRDDDNDRRDDDDDGNRADDDDDDDGNDDDDGDDDDGDDDDDDGDDDDGDDGDDDDDDGRDD